MTWLYAWLVELEEGDKPGTSPTTYTGHFAYGDARGLLDSLRTGFLSFCNHTPSLAEDYLARVKAREHSDREVSSTLKFRGTLAQAAPQTARGTDRGNAHRSFEAPRALSIGRPRRAFSLHGQLLPAGVSGARTVPRAPHAFAGRGAQANQTPRWPCGRVDRARRGPGGKRPSDQLRSGRAVLSLDRDLQLVARPEFILRHEFGVDGSQAWAHARLDADENFDDVLKDVLGAGSSVAFVLIAVDLIISHWPKSRAAAIPFLGCPELLSLDRTRQMHDQMQVPDLFGLSAIEREPRGGSSKAALRERPSRSMPLEHLVGIYAYASEALREKLRALLEAAVQRLGALDATSTFADPRLMAQHALNLIDKVNWRETEVEQADGSKVQALAYVPPKAEADHMAALSAEAAPRFAASSVRAEIDLAIDDRSKSLPDLALRGAAWARDEEALLAESATMPPFGPIQSAGRRLSFSVMVTKTRERSTASGLSGFSSTRSRRPRISARGCELGFASIRSPRRSRAFSRSIGESQRLRGLRRCLGLLRPKALPAPTDLRW